MAEDVAFAVLMLATSVAGALIAFGIGYWLRTLTKPAVEKPVQPAAAGAGIATDVMAVNAWVSWNPWYLQDEAWRLEAQSIHLFRQRTHPGEPLEENLAEVAAEMRPSASRSDPDPQLS